MGSEVRLSDLYTVTQLEGEKDLNPGSQLSVAILTANSMHNFKSRCFSCYFQKHFLAECEPS